MYFSDFGFLISNFFITFDLIIDINWFITSSVMTFGNNNLSDFFDESEIISS